MVLTVFVSNNNRFYPLLQDSLEFINAHFTTLKSKQLIFFPKHDIVLRARRRRGISKDTNDLDIRYIPTNYPARLFELVVALDLRENRWLPEVPGAWRVWRLRDHDLDGQPGIETEFVELNGIATTSWREAGFGHTVFELENPVPGKTSGRCRVIAPDDFMKALADYD